MEKHSYLSNKDIAVNERLIFALDVASIDEAKVMVESLGDTVSFYKLGLELLMSGDYFELLSWLAQRNKKIFADIKLHDVPQTVSSAVRQLTQYKELHFLTIHAQDAMLRAAHEERGNINILAVTVLTSLEQKDINELGLEGTKISDLVVSRARNAIDTGCAGVIASGLEAMKLREELGQDFIIVSPGIRPSNNTVVDDQKRTVDVEEAFHNGADYIVMGRPIRQDYKSQYGVNSPKEAAAQIQQRIGALFGQ